MGLDNLIDSLRLSLQRAGPVALIVANCIPLVGVLFWGWSVGAIVTLYWAENLIVGIVTLLKMYHLKQNAALGRMAFFTMHYGLFWAAHGAILVSLIDSHPAHATGGFMTGAGSTANETSTGILGPASEIFNDASGIWMAAFTALFVSHIVSLFVNYFRREEYLAETLNDLMMAPYKRVMVMHIGVLIGGIAAEKLGSGVYLLIALVVMKTIIDVVLHNQEHGRDGHAYASSGNNDSPQRPVNRAA